MKRHLNERIFRRQISTRRERKQLLLAALTACFLKINVLVFEINRETDKKKEKNRPTLFRTGVTTKQIYISPVQRLNRLR